MYIAHINENGEKQTCINHCINTAEYAMAKLSNVGLSNVAYLSGLLHDAGKFSEEFNNYILDSFNKKPTKKGSVIHSFSGCSFMLNNYHSNDLDIKNVTAEIIAYAIAAHHGLFDCVDEDGNNGFEHRLLKQPNYDEKSISNFFRECKNKYEIDEIFKKAVSEIELAIKSLFVQDFDKVEIENNTKIFYIGLLTRLILSATIDGDRVDTYSFMAGIDISSQLLSNSFDWKKIIENVEIYIDSKSGVTDIQKARKELSDICKSFSNNKTDIYQIKLPTGAGKTLSGLRYAVNHAQKHNKKRIFYIAPLISILEQNSKVIQNAVGDSSIVLEHHSNVVIEEDGKFDRGIYNRNQLLTENWDSPIVITTLVQFLNTLFGEKTSQVRRFSSLVDSVIIIDEVQTVPWKMLSLFNIAMNFLKKVCNATILLCSATQPSFNNLDYKMIVSDLKLLTNEQDEYYSQVFKRSKLVFDGNYRLNDIPNYITTIINNVNSILVICNKKTQAETLYKALKNQDFLVFHLSASMCMEHRERVLEEINAALFNHKNKVICVSTQVIEAGVDISFETVVRFETGLDGIIQANGRCNRDGELDYISNTHIVRCSDEDLTKLEEIGCAKSAMTELLEVYKNDENKFDNDLSSDKAIEKYYECLYRSFSEKKTHYYIRKYDTTLLNLLSDNEWRIKHEYYSDKRYFLNQAFKSAGKAFEPLDCDSISVLVPYMEGTDIISNLCSEKALHDIKFAKDMIDKSKRFSVSLMRYQAKKIDEQGGLYKILNDTIYVLRNNFYSNEVGVINYRKEESEECNILIL